jgi:hypothetical protein
MGGSRKKRKRSNLFQQAVDTGAAGFRLAHDPNLGNLGKNAKNAFGTSRELVGNTVNELTGTNEQLAQNESAAAKAARAQEKFLNQQLQIENNRIADTNKQRAKEEADANEGLAQLDRDEKRRSARSRQKAQARGAGGRRSTILTGNRSLGAPATARKTLLG